jgi:hypothetical protein
MTLSLLTHPRLQLKHHQVLEMDLLRPNTDLLLSVASARLAVSLKMLG